MAQPPTKQQPLRSSAIAGLSWIGPHLSSFIFFLFLAVYPAICSDEARSRITSRRRLLPQSQRAEQRLLLRNQRLDALPRECHHLCELSVVEYLVFGGGLQ